MTRMSIADAQRDLDAVIARSQCEAVFIERRGQHAAVVLSPDRYEQMLAALEDSEDAAAFDEAMVEQ